MTVRGSWRLDAPPKHEKVSRSDWSVPPRKQLGECWHVGNSDLSTGHSAVVNSGVIFRARNSQGQPSIWGFSRGQAAYIEGVVDWAAPSDFLRRRAVAKGPIRTLQGRPSALRTSHFARRTSPEAARPRYLAVLPFAHPSDSVPSKPLAATVLHAPNTDLLEKETSWI
jgi:hypothetical protein